MPWKKVSCPKCGRPMSRRSVTCRACFVPYERTPQHRQRMSDVLTGKAHPWLEGKKRPEHSRKMKEWWTLERRQEMSRRQLALNPLARYHGLSSRMAKRLCDALGHCEFCGHDGSESRLGVHHRNRNKQDQSLGNLIVLCHRCHMREHAKRGETGWQSYHRKRKMNQD